jgi:hypothetical protein
LRQDQNLSFVYHVRNNGSTISDYFSFFSFCFVKDVSFVSACNAEFCNNLEAVYFCRGRNFIPFSKKMLGIMDDWIARLITVPEGLHIYEPHD